MRFDYLLELTLYSSQIITATSMRGLLRPSRSFMGISDHAILYAL
jgi:hypothetical protein